MAAVLVWILALLAPAIASAAFHEAVIDEVMLGVMVGASVDLNAQYVEIRMLSSLQTQVEHSRLSFFTCNGGTVSPQLIVPNNLTNGGAGVRWSMGTTEFRDVTGVTPDFFFPAVQNNSGLGLEYFPCGMVCWGAPGSTTPPDPFSWPISNPNNYVDCVAFGGYMGTTKTTSGTPTALDPGDGMMSLTRIGTTGNNLADFAFAAPSPTNNGPAGTTTTTSTTVPGGASTSTTLVGATTTTATVPGATTTTSTTLPPGSGQPVSNGRILLKDGARPGKRSLVVRAKDSSIVAGDPLQSGGSLRVFTTAGDAFDDTYLLPATGWKRLGRPSSPPRYRFKDPAGAIKLVKIGPGAFLQVKGKGAGLMHTLGADPTPVGIVLAVGAERDCLSFGNAPIFKPGKKFAAGSTPLAACP